MTTLDPAKLTIKLNVHKDSNISYSKVRIDSMTIIFPDILQFQEGQSGLNGQTLTISDAVFSGGMYTKELYVTGLNFGNAIGEGIKPVKENGKSVIKTEQDIAVQADVTVSDVSGTGSLNIAPSITLAAINCGNTAGYEKVNTALDIPFGTKAYIPVAGETPAASIPEGDYYSGGNIDWSPKNFVNGTFAGNTEYTARFTLETKRTGADVEPLTDYLYPENFEFSLKGSRCSTEVSADGTTATVTAVFPATENNMPNVYRPGAPVHQVGASTAAVSEENPNTGAEAFGFLPFAFFLFN